MKNPYLRSALITSLILAVLFTVSSIVGQWAELYSIAHYGSTTLSSFTETPNIYENISSVLNYVQIITSAPLLVLYVLGPFLVGMLLEYIGPIMIFASWFIFLYIVTYLYAKHVKKNVVTESKSQGLLITICILVTVALSGWQLFYLYQQEVAFIPQTITLDSVSPQSGSNGDYITLTGSGFSKQELTIWLFDSQKNLYGYLWDGQPTDDKTIRIPLKTIGLCDNAVQNPCLDALENFGAGTYSIQIRGGSNTPSVPFEVIATTTGVTFTGTPSKSQEINGKVYSQSFTIPINYLPISTLTSMMEQNAGIQIDKDITDTNFPGLSQAGKEETLQLMSFDQYVSTDEADKVIDSMGYRPANIDEFLSFAWNDYKSLQDTPVSTAIISQVPIGAVYKTPVFHWVNGVPKIDLRGGAAYQEASEYTLVVKK